MIADPTPRHPEPPSRGHTAVPYPTPTVACPVLGLPPHQDDTYGWVGYESAHPGAWLAGPLSNDGAADPT